MKLFVVIGLGQFGRHTAQTLFAGGGDVLAIDKDEMRVERIKDYVGQAICADASDVEILRSLNVAKADTAIIALGESDLESSIMICSALSDLGIGRLIVRASTELQGRILTRVGASRIIYPEKQIGEQLAKSILSFGSLEQMVLPSGQVVAHIGTWPEMVGKTVKDIEFNENYRLVLIGVQRPKRSINDKGELQEQLILHSAPSSDFIIAADDILVLAGNQDQVEHFAIKD